MPNPVIDLQVFYEFQMPRLCVLYGAAARVTTGRETGGMDARSRGSATGGRLLMRAPKGLFAVGVLRTLGALALVLVFTLPGSVSALAQSSMALPSSESPASGTDRLVAHYALGFRGDRSLDLATVVEEAIAPSTLYIVQLQLSSGAEQSIAVAAPPGGLQLEMRDMTGDRVPNDLVLTPTLLRWPLTVLVN